MARLRIPYTPPPQSQAQNTSFYFTIQLNEHVHLAPENTQVVFVAPVQQERERETEKQTKIIIQFKFV